MITEAEASTYQVPEQDELTIDDDAETISSPSTADYNREEVKTSPSTISDTFHTIVQEYEKLTDTMPHMSKIQAAQVIARLPVLPILKQVKKEKAEIADAIEIEPVPGTSTDRLTAGAGKSTEELTGEAIVEQTTEEGDDEPNESGVDEYFQKYMLSGKGKNHKEKIQEACKEIHYRNLVVLIAVGDYVVNQARNIKKVTKKWGLSFSAIQRAMSRKREHSIGGRQYAKKKKTVEKQGDPVKRINELKRKVQPSQLRLEAHHLWSPTKIPLTVRNCLTCLGHTHEGLKGRIIKINRTLTRNRPLHHDRITRLQVLYHSP